MDRLHYFEDLEVGGRWESSARTVTETDILQFAGMTGDFDPLHVDHEYARETPYGQIIAHGLLGLSWVAGLASRRPSVRTLAFAEIGQWRFVQPIYVGDTVRAITEVLEKSDPGRRSGRVTWLRSLVNQRDEILQQGTFVTVVATAAAARRTRVAAHSAA